MDLTTSSWLVRLTVGAHAVLAVWLLVNGAAHQIGVLWGAWRGTLRRPDELEAMLAVGAGLLVAGALASWSLPALTRGATGFALTSVVALAAIVGMIAARFGWTFLGGTALLGTIDAIVLVLAAGYGIRQM
jgi:hypothetical protein